MDQQFQVHFHLPRLIFVSFSVTILILSYFFGETNLPRLGELIKKIPQGSTSEFCVFKYRKQVIS